ncbi:hypothetical protein CVU83_02650 [Candidatus Falkowbacteria bacterium HGW-Falkowbacteria-2]|uniref:Uncharacterized protein n=1 Tax=Candidatus Falkowbacteria bacterium HGW-Falkowbacteria-2 TaxID=2013769 RepID=A0A2N2DZ45_9BACT|nr:MAG: hypothetical protein CVU83_02650 [Candidatus Falkowbacteria bacterium HGW-Falkowbacteria-2]
MTKVPPYRIQTGKRFIRDAESVKFHVDNNDYFGTAATLLGLIRETLASEIKKAPDKNWAPVEIAFKNLEQDLLILQGSYHIKANKRKVQAEPRGKLKSQ